MPSQSNQIRYPSYLDFEIEIGPSDGRVYPVAIIHSPVGESRATTTFPFDTRQPLEIQLPTLAETLRDIKAGPDIAPSAAQSVQTFGQAIFEALLPNELRSLYYESQREAARQNKGLRIKLRIQPPELAALPWEFLYDPRQAEYVCLSRATPVVRYIEQPQVIQPLLVVPPLRILGVVASPRNLAPLNVDREQRSLEEALADLKAHGLVELDWLVNPTWRTIQQAIRRSDWHVFHFIGHGGFDHELNTGVIAFADDTGDADYLSATQLARLLGDHEPLRLALLNACEGAHGSTRDLFASTAANLVRRGTPAVLAMQYPISDSTAREFARTFYESLADTLPVDAAVAEARKAISFTASSNFEWGIPVLFMRTSDGMLFMIQQQTAMDKPLDQAAEGTRPAPGEDAAPQPSAGEQPDQAINALFSQLAQAQTNHAWDSVIALGKHILELAPTHRPSCSRVAATYGACGRSNYQSHDFDRAISYFESAIALEPDNVVWYYWRGISYEQKGDHEQAAADIERALSELDHLIQQAPDNAEYYATRGSSYAWKGDFDRAIADLSRAIDLAPNTAEHYYARGSSYSQLADFSRAVADFSRAVALAPTNPDYYYARASAYYGAGNYDRAIADLNQAIDADPNNPQYYQLRGSSFHQAVFYGQLVGDYDHAIADFTRAIELDPANPDHYYSRGNSYYQLAVHRRLTDVDRAIADFTRAIDLAPNTADFYYARGLSYKLQRNREAAQHDFQHAVGLGHPQAKSELDLWKRLFS